MFRHLLEEAFEELKQTVAPERPEISFPKPPGSYPLPRPSEAVELLPHEGPPIEKRAPAAPVRRRAAPPRAVMEGGVRSQLATRSSLRSAFQLMEVLGPPVSLRDPAEGGPGR